MQQVSLTTELILSNWRFGQTIAERLAAALLSLEGYKEIDPQAPLGGPDGRKDILCIKGKSEYVAGVYFATKQRTFPTIKKKFIHDLEGVKAHKRNAFAFLANQAITVKQREVLLELAEQSGATCEIYHIERIIQILNSPTGYGRRLEFTGIAMNFDEQFAYFVHNSNSMEKVIQDNSNELYTINYKLDQLLRDQEDTKRTIHQISGALGFSAGPPPSTANFLSFGPLKSDRNELSVTTNLSVAALNFVHRLVCFDLPSTQLGKFRTQVVWVGQVKAGKPSRTSEVLEPAEILSALELLCEQWNNDFVKISTHSSQKKILKIAMFHSKFLKIHPYLDGNGRVARAILMQQCLDLFRYVDMSLFDKGAPYFNALETADAGDHSQLIKLISVALGIQINNSNR